jgi:hypothetical protein
MRRVYRCCSHGGMWRSIYGNCCSPGNDSLSDTCLEIRSQVLPQNESIAPSFVLSTQDLSSAPTGWIQAKYIAMFCHTRARSRCDFINLFTDLCGSALSQKITQLAPKVADSDKWRGVHLVVQVVLPERLLLSLKQEFNERGENHVRDKRTGRRKG